MNEPILVVETLSKAFGNVVAVAGCDFRVERGAITGLIGPNGAGKSTAIDLIAGFSSPDAGKVTFDGEEITHLEPHVIARRGLVRTFQQSRGWPKLTVMENLLVAAPARRRESVWRAFYMPQSQRKQSQADRERARALLKTFDLYRLRNDQVQTLSGGQRRLLEVCRIMMAEPKLVILDEPVASVNPVMAESVAMALKHVVALGITVLVVEHSLSFVAGTCSSVIVMAAGAVIAHGPLSELQRQRAVVDAYLGDLSGTLG